MAVKILMSLEGVDQVTAGFAEAQKAGEDMMRSITGLSDQDPLKGFSLSIGSATQAMGEHGRAVSGVTESYHVLAPLLREVGLSIGELRGLSILARDSLLGLAVVVGAGIAIGLAKLEEQTAQLKGTLTDLAGGSKAGQQAFDDLTKSAATLGTSVGALAPGLEAAIVAFQRFQALNAGGVKFVAFDTSNLPAALNSIKTATDAYTNFILLLRAGRLDEAQAETAAKSFFTTLGNSGKLTSDLLRQLPTGTVDELAKALGRGGEQTQVFIAEVDKLNISTKQAEQALAAYKAQSQNAFDAKAIITFNDELKKTGEIFLTEFQKISGEPFSEFVNNQFKSIQNDIKTTSEQIQQLTGLWNEFKAAAVSPIGRPGEPLDIGGLPVEGAGAFQTTIDAAKTAGEKIPQPLLDAFLKIQTGFNAMAAEATSSFGQVATAIGSVAAASNTAAVGVDAFGNSLANAVLKAGDVTRITKAFQGFIPTSGFATLPGEAGVGGPQAPAIKAPLEITLDDQSLADAITKATDKVDESATELGTQAGLDINEGITAGLADNPADFKPIEDSLVATGQQLATQAQTIWDNLKNILSQTITIPVQTSTGFAGGGLVSGPGTGTSDSIMAMLSNREFVVNARSTEFYGPGFFAALNAMLVPRDLLPGFAMGGLVKAIATTNGAGDRRPFILQIAGKGDFKGSINAPDSIVEALSREGVFEQMAQGGRSPGWRRS